MSVVSACLLSLMGYGMMNFDVLGITKTVFREQNAIDPFGGGGEMPLGSCACGKRVYGSGPAGYKDP